MSPRSQQQRGHILLVFSNLLNLKKLNYCYRIWKYPKNEAFKIYCQCLHTSNSHVRIVFLPCIVIEEESDRRGGKGRRCCLGDVPEYRTRVRSSIHPYLQIILVRHGIESIPKQQQCNCRLFCLTLLLQYACSWLQRRCPTPESAFDQE